MNDQNLKHVFKRRTVEMQPRPKQQCPLCFQMFAYSTFSKHYNKRNLEKSRCKMLKSDIVTKLQKKVNEMEERLSSALVPPAVTNNTQVNNVTNKVTNKITNNITIRDCDINIFGEFDDSHIHKEEMIAILHSGPEAIIKIIHALNRNPKNQSMRKVHNPITKGIRYEFRQMSLGLGTSDWIPWNCKDYCVNQVVKQYSSF